MKNVWIVFLSLVVCCLIVYIIRGNNDVVGEANKTTFNLPNEYLGISSNKGEKCIFIITYTKSAKKKILDSVQGFSSSTEMYRELKSGGAVSWKYNDESSLFSSGRMMTFQGVDYDMKLGNVFVYDFKNGKIVPYQLHFTVTSSSDGNSVDYVLKKLQEIESGSYENPLQFQRDTPKNKLSSKKEK